MMMIGNYSILMTVTMTLYSKLLPVDSHKRSVM